MPHANSLDKTLRERAAAVIPNGMYGHESVRLLPDVYPQFFGRAEGARLWDVDGREYLDFMCGYGPNLFGYRNHKIDMAAKAQAELGDAMTGPGAVMVELAEKFVQTIGHATWVMFCKNGTDATTMAISTARAHTGKRKILVAKGAYHGAAPWCTPVPAGVVPEDRAHLITYIYNDIESLEAAVIAAGDDLAGIVASPFKHAWRPICRAGARQLPMVIRFPRLPVARRRAPRQAPSTSPDRSGLAPCRWRQRWRR